jgi:pimeloyl-ACP methyl ester carboxylesterase
VLYLHGFASGPGSTKARFFRARLADLGTTLDIPELAPDFTHQTITGMLGIVAEHLARAPAILLGSSLGGYLAALAAARQPARVRALVLFAPAFGFAARWEARLGDAAMARWRAERTMPVFHYGEQRELPLAIDLLDDARRHPDEPDPPAPALIFAGRNDDTVPLAAVEHFAAARPGRELVVLDSGHELTDVLEPMWQRTQAFLSRPETLSPGGTGARLKRQ